MKNYITIFIVALLFSSCEQKKPVIGYEYDNNQLIDLEAGDVQSTQIVKKFFDAYNKKDLKTVYELEHEDVKFYTPDGTIIYSRDEHYKLGESFISNVPDATFNILWSMSANVPLVGKSNENWVTTCVSISFTQGEEKVNIQRIVDTQILDGKIKKGYIYERTISEEEIKEVGEISIYDNSIRSIIDDNASIEILGDSIALPEGPVWDESSKSLIFVDVLSNKILKWNEDEGVTDYIIPGGNTGYAPNLGVGVLGPNGLLIDKNGDLIVCQHGDRRIAKIANNFSISPSFETIVESYDGNRLNSPNDLTMTKDGVIYFTDPAFGFLDMNTFSFVETEMRELDFNGVYKFDTKTSSLSLITDKINLPNGIALSTDEKFIYVNKMGMFDGVPNIIKLDLQTLESEVFFDGSELASEYEGNFDGMKVHSSGNIFTSGPGGVLVISPEGDLKAKLDFGHVTNVAFDTNEEYLYATGFLNNPKIFRLKLK